MMKKFKKFLALILSMLMLISVFQVGASAYFPYINVGGENDAISSKYQITSVNVTDLYGDAVNSLNAGDGVLVSCKVKSLDESGSVQLIAVAYSGSEMVAVKRSDVVTLGKNAEDIGVYLTVSKAADSFKAFLWDGSANLIPLTKSADTASDAVNVLSVEFNGEAVDKDIATHDVTIPVYQLDMPSVQILTDNPAARVEVTSNKTFPLTKQWDSEEGSATVTATVTLNGAEKAKYIFNVTQAVPEITNLTQYKWDGGRTSYEHTSLTPDTPAGSYSVSLEQVKEADYSGVEYMQSTISTSLPGYEELPVVRTMLANDNLGTGLGVSMCHNISPTFLNAALIQQTESTSAMHPYCTESFHDKDEAQADVTYDINDYKSFSFDINRSATVYVYNPENATYGNNHDGFINKGFEYKENEFELNYYYAHSKENNRRLSKYVNWYVKHIPVADDKVSVEIPVGAKSMFVLIKFDDVQGESVISNVSYTKTDNSTVATTTTKLFDPIPKHKDMEFIDKPTAANLDDYIYKVQPWSGGSALALTGIGEEVLGGEVINMPLNPADIKNLTFTLNESADVYFVVNINNPTLGHWRTAALDWFENGWRMLGQGEAPVEGILYRGGSGAGKMLSYANYQKHAVKKHFEIDTPVTVSLNLGKFQEIDSFKANSYANHNQRTMLVIVKKTDR